MGYTYSRTTAADLFSTNELEERRQLARSYTSGLDGEREREREREREQQTRVAMGHIRSLDTVASLSKPPPFTDRIGWIFPSLRPHDDG